MRRTKSKEEGEEDVVLCIAMAEAAEHVSVPKKL